MAVLALEFLSVHRPAAADVAVARLRAVGQFKVPRTRWCHGLAGSLATIVVDAGLKAPLTAASTLVGGRQSSVAIGVPHL